MGKRRVSITITTCLGLSSSPEYKQVTPGSVGIIANLKRAGLLVMYEQAGFVIGAPGCSYCIGELPGSNLLLRLTELTWVAASRDVRRQGRGGRDLAEFPEPVSDIMPLHCHAPGLL